MESIDYCGEAGGVTTVVIPRGQFKARVVKNRDGDRPGVKAVEVSESSDEG